MDRLQVNFDCLWLSSEIPIVELISESIPQPFMIMEPIPESIVETNSGPTFRNRFQKILELTGIDSDENFIFPITTSDIVPDWF